MIIIIVTTIAWIISSFNLLNLLNNFSTNKTLDCNAKEWVVYLMEALTGRDASFLSVTSGSDQGSQSSTRAYQESPTARARLASCPPVSPSISTRGEVSSPPPVSFSVSVPVGSVVELTPADAIKYLSSLDHPNASVQLPLDGSGGGGHTPQQPLPPADDLPQQPLPPTDDLHQQPLPPIDLPVKKVSGSRFSANIFTWLDKNI